MSTHLSAWIRELLAAPPGEAPARRSGADPFAWGPVPALPSLRADMLVRRSWPSDRGKRSLGGGLFRVESGDATPDSHQRIQATKSPLLTWVPADDQEPADNFRLVFWPHGVPNGPFVGLLSSRLRRELSSHRSWFTALRELEASLVPDAVLVTAQKTTPFPFAQRLAPQQARRLVTIYLPNPAQEAHSPRRWWRHLNSLRFPVAAGIYPAVFSPLVPFPTEFNSRRIWRSPFEIGRTAPENRITHSDLPLPMAPRGDRAVAQLADHLMILRLRKQGRLLPWIRGQLKQTELPRLRRIWLAVGSELVTPAEAEKLIPLGASWWRSFQDAPPLRSNTPVKLKDGPRHVPVPILANPNPDDSRPGKSDHGSERTPGLSAPAPLAPTNLAPVSTRIVEVGHLDRIPSASWTYLTHCTRRRDGPWPGQTDEQYWDDLLWDRPEADHSALATLRRIVSTRLLAGASRGMRGGTTVVCWTEVPLHQLAELHTYRPHRVRWDFCPYGICIERAWLEKRGARPVIYAPSSKWDLLSDKDRPFFQLQPDSQPPAPSSGWQEPNQRSDWRVEREWRTLGDLDLRDLPPDSAFVFVPTREEVGSLVDVSLWPVRLSPAGFLRRRHSRRQPR